MRRADCAIHHQRPGATHADLEIIVGDNASTDATWSVVEQLAAADRRIRPFRNETNLGPTRNWMRAIEHCRGDYVKVLWSDDWIEPNCVEELLRPMAEAPDIAMAFSAVILRFADRDLPAHHFPERTQFTAAEYLRDALLGGRTPVSPGCALVRREAARFRWPIGTNPELNRIAERYGAGPDLLFLLEAAAQSSRVAHVPKFLTYFGAGATSITVCQPREVQEGYRLAREYFAEQLADRPDLRRVKARLNLRRWRHSLKRALHL